MKKNNTTTTKKHGNADPADPVETLQCNVSTPTINKGESNPTADKYRNKYRVPSSRLQSWDYRWDGAYFITICTKNRYHYFGEIVDGAMQLNDVGKMAQQYWAEIPDHFDNAYIDAFVVMPNHVHGIIILSNSIPTKNDGDSDPVETLQCNVSTPTINHGQFSPTKFHSHISPKPKSISTIIRSFKSVCTKTINESHPDINFLWQPRFHDHIIRNEVSLEHTRQYIISNPAQWDDDENNILV